MRRLTDHNGRALAWAVPILAETAALLRSLILAWTLGPEELGRAMMLALILRMIEMGSDLGGDRLILQARDGNSLALQQALHGAALLRGGLSAVVLLALAPLLPTLFTDGPTASSYAWLALVPMIRGAVHLDYRRAERQRRYGPLASVEGGATLIMLISLAPALWLIGDHRAIAPVVMAHASALLVLSHLVAHRAYGAQFKAAAFRRIWRFGAPLLLNALLMFLTFYADRLIVAAAYDWATLALYGIALQLAMLPAQIIGRAAGSLVLPRLRRALNTGAFPEVWNSVLSLHMLMTMGLIAGFALLAPTVIELIYGAAFRPDAWLALAFGSAAGLRVLRTPYSQLAIATGRTGDPARANLWRALALLPATACALLGWPLAAVAAATALGEGAATMRAAQLAAPTLTPTHRREATI